MNLSSENLAEIRVYIFGTPKYRETYYELYDHILNALEQMEGTYDINLVRSIVDEDLGGFEGIVHQEEIYQKSVTAKYNRLLGKELLNSYKTST